jgi:hypothetical protein
MAKLGHNQPTNQRMIEAREKHQHALRLRRAGMEYQDIARIVGYTDRRSAQRAVQTELDAQGSEDAAAVRTMEASRLDALLFAVWKRAMNGDGWAVRHALEIMERRARMLGLDAPVKQSIEVITDSVLDEEIAELTQKLADRDAAKAREAADAAGTEPADR